MFAEDTTQNVAQATEVKENTEVKPAGETAKPAAEKPATAKVAKKPATVKGKAKPLTAKPASKEAKPVKAKKEKKEKAPSGYDLILSVPKKELSQEVIPFGKDKLSVAAEAMYLLCSRRIERLKQKKILATEIVADFKHFTNIDMTKVYDGSSEGRKWPNSPIHQGLHAISKGETEEFADAEKTKDGFARGARFLIFKTKRVGLNNGYYEKNPNRKYKDPSDDLLKTMCKKVVANIPQTQKDYAGIK
jgi:hypothetical protein